MKKENSDYNKLVCNMKKLKNGGESLSENEKVLVEQLSFIVNMDRNNKIISDIIHNNQQLLYLIEVIDQNITNLKNQINNNSSDSDSVEFLKIEKLEELKNEILDFEKRQSYFSEDLYDALVSKCVFILSSGLYEMSDYFGKPFAISKTGAFDRFNLDEETINRVYQILSDEQFVSQLRNGFDIFEANKYIQKVLENCDEAHFYKDVLYENIDDIIMFNRINKDLRKMNLFGNASQYDGLDDKLIDVEYQIYRISSNFFTKVFNHQKLKELRNRKMEIISLKNSRDEFYSQKNELEIKLNEVEEKLCSCGLGVVFSKLNKKTVSFIADDKKDYSLESNISTFFSKKDIDKYFQDISRIKDEWKQDDTAIIHSEVLDLLNQDYETVKNMIHLMNGKKKAGVSPYLALFILEMLIVMKKTDLGDIEVKEDVFEKRKDYFDNIISNKCKEYHEKLSSILNGNSDFSEDKLYQKHL